MTTDQYKSLSEKERIFVDLAQEILAELKKLSRDISADIERTLQ